MKMLFALKIVVENLEIVSTYSFLLISLLKLEEK